MTDLEWAIRFVHDWSEAMNLSLLLATTGKHEPLASIENRMRLAKLSRPPVIPWEELALAMRAQLRLLGQLAAGMDSSEESVKREALLGQIDSVYARLLPMKPGSGVISFATPRLGKPGFLRAHARIDVHALGVPERQFDDAHIAAIADMMARILKQAVHEGETAKHPAPPIALGDTTDQNGQAT